ncbi:MAG: hypothetical protein KBB54_00540 [Candidatus Pacebacteria bacterium]|nr:hypothetical protein [Candidatus Paceibacterota bacterium]MBP9819024.1 hypothetical protein [Candidatus Paceibacterota bacterium]
MKATRLLHNLADSDKYRFDAQKRQFILKIKEAILSNVRLSVGQKEAIELWISLECSHFSSSFMDGHLLEVRARMAIATYINGLSVSK